MDDGDAGDEECWWDFDCSAVVCAELVVEAVFSADEWCAVGLCCVVAAFACADEGGHVVRFVAAWPAEVVEYCCSCWVCADADEVSHAFVDCGERHEVWVAVVLCVSDGRREAAGDGEAFG